MFKLIPTVIVFVLFTSASIAEGKAVNVSLNPFSLMNGTIDAGVDVRVSKAWSIGPYGYYNDNIDAEDDSIRALGLGLRADYSFKGDVFEDGAYVSPFASRYEFSGRDFDATATNVGAVFGYRWQWESGMNMRLGLGAMHSDIATKNDSAKDIPNSIGRYKGWLPTGDIVVGFSF